MAGSARQFETFGPPCLTKPGATNEVVHTMNIRKTLLAGALSLGLLGSIAAPAVTVTAQDAADTVYVTVDIGAGGTFNPYFCAADAFPLATTQDPTAHTPGWANGQLSICYTDTLPYRNSFRATVGATAFTSTNAAHQTPIAPGNLKVVYSYNVIQQHWGSDGHAHPIRIGDIGHYKNNAYPNYTGGQASGPWTTDNTFDTARTIGFGWNGLGTGTSTGYFDVTLEIPGGTSPGAYASTLTLTILPASEHVRSVVIP